MRSLKENLIAALVLGYFGYAAVQVGLHYKGRYDVSRLEKEWPKRFTELHVGDGRNRMISVMGHKPTHWCPVKELSAQLKTVGGLAIYRTPEADFRAEFLDDNPKGPDTITKLERIERGDPLWNPCNPASEE